jgi:hypothetical protein
LPSIEEYVLVAQDRPLVERYVRQADATWAMKTFAELTETLEFGTVPVRVALADVYRDVEFAPTDLK